MIGLAATAAAFESKHCPCCGRKYDFPKVAVSLELNSISYRRKTLFLAPTQIEMLWLLADRMPNPVLREVMFERVWRAFSDREPNNNLDVNICKLRKAIAPLGLSIETIRERGWRMKKA